MLMVMLRLIIFTLYSGLHPFYVSVTELNYRPAEKELQITCKFFTDDFEEALKNYSGEKTDLKKGDQNRIKKLAEAYLRQHFRIRANQVEAKFELLGYENDQEATWFYLVSKDMPAITTIDLYNDLLYETRTEQINLMHVVVDGKRKSYRLTAPDTKASFEFL